MRKYTIIAACMLASLLTGSCNKEEKFCKSLIGTYTGTFTGTFDGILTFVVTESFIEGTWSGTDESSGTMLTGDIHVWNFDCFTGILDDDLGLGLTGPQSILCPAGSTQYRCYDTGATLGIFKGTLTETSGSGIWRADSGAAGTVGVTGNGSWSVTKI